MSNTFEKYSDDQLFDYLESNCPEGKLFEAFDELATRMEFYRLIVTDMANQGGMTLDEFIKYFDSDDEEPDLESMSLAELQQYYQEQVAKKKEDAARQELIKKIKELNKE